MLRPLLHQAANLRLRKFQASAPRPAGAGGYEPPWDGLLRQPLSGSMGIRTPNPLLARETLYQLELWTQGVPVPFSFRGSRTLVDLVGFEPTTFTLPACCSTRLSLQTHDQDVYHHASTIAALGFQGASSRWKGSSPARRTVEPSSCVLPRGLEPRTTCLRGTCSAIELEELVLRSHPWVRTRTIRFQKPTCCQLHQVGKRLRLPAGWLDCRSTR